MITYLLFMLVCAFARIQKQRVEDTTTSDLFTYQETQWPALRSGQSMATTDLVSQSSCRTMSPTSQSCIHSGTGHRPCCLWKQGNPREHKGWAHSASTCICHPYPWRIQPGIWVEWDSKTMLSVYASRMRNRVMENVNDFDIVFLHSGFKSSTLYHSNIQSPCKWYSQTCSHFRR